MNIFSLLVSITKMEMRHYVVKQWWIVMRNKFAESGFFIKKKKPKSPFWLL